MGDLTESSIPQAVPPSSSSSRHVPFREDCWTEEATATLVDAWGRRYLELNRGNLRQKDWQEVADAVNARHGLTKKTRRTDVQCKNRIDTLKKKYKTEKAKISESNGTVPSSWPFYSRLEYLIGSGVNKHQSKVSPSVMPLASSQSTPPLSLPSPPFAVPLAYRKPLSPAMVTPVILPQKRPMSSPAVDESYFRKNYSAMAAAAAAAEDEPDEDDGGLDGDEAEGSEDRAAEEEDVGDSGMRRLAKAIETFGEIFEKVESMKQRQMVELEKQRMQFTKDLEVQRMQLFMDTQVQLEKMRQAKRSGSSEGMIVISSDCTDDFSVKVGTLLRIGDQSENVKGLIKLGTLIQGFGETGCLVPDKNCKSVAGVASDAEWSPLIFSAEGTGIANLSAEEISCSWELLGFLLSLYLLLVTGEFLENNGSILII
ncbi:hypothetical protein DH2020_042030 [Rehmannia glutinosa]|uniref:Myb/SANT-like DNA-binding domain-containing protein n=1 Tax=Rehmannia glutinosa TaxID=99300 RepID=A0ABR0UNE7_REHGL